jgi:uncharacterized protein YerC
MTQVSKIPLRKEIEKRMYDVFLDSIAMVHTRSQVQKLLMDWLSPTEKVMLAKRLSIALLLTKQYNQRQIAKLLHVGLETVNKVNKVLTHGDGGYMMVLSVFLKQEKQEAFWEKIDDARADIFPPRHRDWSKWRKERWENKMRGKKPY